MQVNVHQAKTQLSQLLQLVENGEKVVIARNGKPIAELVRTSPKSVFPFGIASKKPLVKDGDTSWWQPMSDRQVERWIGKK